MSRLDWNSIGFHGSDLVSLELMTKIITIPTSKQQLGDGVLGLLGVCISPVFASLHRRSIRYVVITPQLFIYPDSSISVLGLNSPVYVYRMVFKGFEGGDASIGDVLLYSFTVLASGDAHLQPT